MNMILLRVLPFIRFYSVAVITRDSDDQLLSRNPGSSPGRTCFSLGVEDGRRVVWVESQGSSYFSFPQASC